MRKALVQRPRISGRHRSHHGKTGYSPMPSPCLADVVASPTPRLSIQAPMKRVGLSKGKCSNRPFSARTNGRPARPPIPLPISQIRQHIGGIRMPIGRAANRMGRCSSRGCRPDAQPTLRLSQIRDGISARRQNQRLVGSQFRQRTSNRPLIRLEPRASHPVAMDVVESQNHAHLGVSPIPIPPRVRQIPKRLNPPLALLRKLMSPNRFRPSIIEPNRFRSQCAAPRTVHP